MLIDAGENDQGDTVISYLNSQGVKELDYVIGTHPHSDHIGGLDKVIEAFPTKQRDPPSHSSIQPKPLGMYWMPFPQEA